MSINVNYNAENQPQVDDKPAPPQPTVSTATLPFIANYMMALLNSIQQTTNNIYNQQAVDAKSLTMLQEYMQSIQQTQSDQINKEIKDHTDNYDNAEAAKVSQMQAEMSAEVEKANSAVGSMKGMLSNDMSNASQALDFFNSLTTISSFLTSLLR